MNLLDPQPIDMDNLQGELAICGVRMTSFANPDTISTFTKAEHERAIYQRINNCGSPTTNRVTVTQESPDLVTYYYCCDAMAHMLQLDNGDKVQVAAYKPANE